VSAAELLTKEADSQPSGRGRRKIVGQNSSSTRTGGGGRGYHRTWNIQINRKELDEVNVRGTPLAGGLRYPTRGKKIMGKTRAHFRTPRERFTKKVGREKLKRGNNLKVREKKGRKRKL